MNASKIIAAVLIIVSLSLAYIGFNKVANSMAEINFLGLKIDASNEKGQAQGYMYLGLAVVLFAGGVYTLNKKD